MSDITLLEAAHLVRSRLAASDQASDIIRDLTRDHGAGYRDANGTYQLRLAGMTCSCTAGPIRLLLDWTAKAQRQLEASS